MMWLNSLLSLQLIVIQTIIFQNAYSSPVGPTGPVIEAEGWTPVRSSQVVRLPQEYLNKNPIVNLLPLDNRSYNEEPVYNNNEASQFEGSQEEVELQNSFGQTGCSIKNGNCVPKCSTLTAEELNDGVQCALDVDPGTEEPWEAVQPSSNQYEVAANLARQQNTQLRIPQQNPVAPSRSPNYENIQPTKNNAKKKLPLNQPNDSDSFIRKDLNATPRQEGDDCGSCFNPARNYFCGNCAPGLECVKDPRSELLPDLPSSCKAILENNENQYTPAEEFEIQRQQSYSGFGEKIQTNVEQRPFLQEREIEQTQRQPSFPQRDRAPTNTRPSFQERNTEQIDPTPASPPQQIKIVKIKEVKPTQAPMIVYPAASDQYDPPLRTEEEPTIIVQTASVVRPEKDPLRKHLVDLGQLQGQFAPLTPPRPPHLRPHPPNRPPPHHPQKQPRPYPRRPGPPKRLSNIIPGGAVPQRPVINGRPPLQPPVQPRRPQPEALPRSSVARPNDQFVSTQPNGPSLPQGRQQRPSSQAEFQQDPSVVPQGPPPSAEPPSRRPLPRQPPPGRARPRPIRQRPTRRPQKGFLDRAKDVVNQAKCEAKKFVSGQMLNDERFIKKQINCVLEKGECDETGKMIKRLAPDVLNNKCPAPCTPCKKQQIKMMMSTIQRKYPKLFADVMRQVRTRS